MCFICEVLFCLIFWRRLLFVFKFLFEVLCVVKKFVIDIYYGIMCIDEYVWLRVDNWQQVFYDIFVFDLEICSYFEVENIYMKVVMVDMEVL